MREKERLQLIKQIEGTLQYSNQFLYQFNDSQIIVGIRNDGLGIQISQNIFRFIQMEYYVDRWDYALRRLCMLPLTEKELMELKQECIEAVELAQSLTDDLRKRGIFNAD